MSFFSSLRSGRPDYRHFLLATSTIFGGMVAIEGAWPQALMIFVLWTLIMTAVFHEGTERSGPHGEQLGRRAYLWYSIRESTLWSSPALLFAAASIVFA